MSYALRTCLLTVALLAFACAESPSDPGSNDDDSRDGGSGSDDDRKDAGAKDAGATHRDAGTTTTNPPPARDAGPTNTSSRDAGSGSSTPHDAGSSAADPLTDFLNGIIGAFNPGGSTADAGRDAGH